MSVEKQRNELIKVIDKCLVFSHFLIIEAGRAAFLFDTKTDYLFDLSLLETMTKHENCKTKIREWSVNGKAENDYRIFSVDLCDEKTRAIMTKLLNRKFGAIYNLDKITTLISFVNLKDLNEAATG
jgi:hypothetical protein